MARDEAVLEAVASGAAPPTLRLYGWSGRWLSIGMAQPVGDVDLAACAASRTRLLRRPSGGTAVLHTRQIGWSLTLPAGHPLALTDIVASYREQAEIALAALCWLGVAAQPASLEAARSVMDEPLLALACFGGLAPNEIVLGQPPRKLIGWGQVRRRGVVMHHSTMSLRFDATALAGLLNADRARLAAALRRAVTDLHDSAGRPVSFAAAADAIARGHADHGLVLEPGELSSDEERRARILVREKYASDGWTFRR